VVDSILGLGGTRARLMPSLLSLVFLRGLTCGKRHKILKAWEKNILAERDD